MLYLFKMLYPQDEEFEMDIAVKGNQTLWDLHVAIRDKLNFKADEPASFLMVSDKDWSIRKEYPSVNFEDPTQDAPMKNITIADVVGRAKQKLLYLFDMFSERYFVLDFVSTADEEKDLEYPVFFNEKGKIPDQTFYDFDLGDNGEEDEDEFGFNDDDMYGLDENDLY